MRALLLDKDGTIIDFQRSWSRAFEELCLDLCNGDSGAAWSMLVAGGLDPSTGRIGAGSVLAAGNTIDIAKAWYPALSGASLRGLVHRMDRTFHENGIRCSVMIPGVRETLAQLAGAGFAMGVATSDGTAGTKAALTALGIEQYLPHVFGYDSVKRPKPAPDIVHAFCAAAGCEPRDVVVVGDNRHDLEMAKNAGAGAAIGVLSGTGGRDHLAPLADALLDSLCDLPAWLRSTD